MILAAGLGQRMRPLTDNLPKPLLQVGGKTLLHYHLDALRAAGIHEVIINLAYLGEKIRAALGDGASFGLRVTYSPESEPLETGGALFNALPLLGTEPFLLINGDVWSDYSLHALTQHDLAEQQAGHLVMVPNPEFHPQGDFALADTGLLVNDETFPRYTFAGISLLRPQVIADYPHCRVKFPLGEVLRYAIDKGALTAEVHRGLWSDIGTPERLKELDQQLSGA
jgi:MurNAc alpha-1-phosphate uridylyltransferase